MILTRSRYVVWTGAVAVYLLAVFNRSSLGVAGLLAAQRFDINAGALSTFTVVQLLVYAGMQIPVGVLLDRYGPRLLLTAGALTMALAQIGFALTGSYAGALTARVFLGMGDAMIFISVLRLIFSWFERRANPVMTAWTALVGQLGAMIAAVPLSDALARYGWTASFLAAGVSGVVLAAVALVVVRDTPPGAHPTAVKRRLREVGRDLRITWRDPGNRLGLWSHFTTQFSSNVFGLLWGFPFLLHAEHLTRSGAAGMLTFLVAVQMAAGPLIGALIARHPWRRSAMVLGIVAAMATMWAIVLAWPGAAPVPVLVALVLVVGFGGPGSMIGFDLARTFTHPRRLGSASGLVNIGGFTASLVCILAIGLTLDALTPGSSVAYSAHAYKLAMLTQYPLWLLGGIQVYRYRHRARRHLRHTQPDVYAEMQPKPGRRRLTRTGLVRSLSWPARRPRR